MPKINERILKKRQINLKFEAVNLLAVFLLLLKKNISMIIKTVFSFFWKIITFKKGSSLILSSIISSVFMLTANPIFDTLLKNTEFKNLVVPIVVQISGFTVFFLFVILDFVTGISFAIYEARKKGKKNYFETERLYRTIWKMLGVLLLTTLVALLVLFTEIIKSSYAYNFTIWALVVVWVLASLFEFHSVGKNIQLRTGSKPEIFGFMDKILDAIQRRALRKIDTVGEENQCEIKEQPTEEVEENEEEAVTNTN